MTVINTNTGSIYAQQALIANSRGLDRTMQQLSTGKRINNSVDDVAGMAIATRLSAQIRGLNQAVRNANDGISIIQTAEGATEQVTNMLQRMRELAVQASNDTYNMDDRTFLNMEFQALNSQIDTIASNTQWNAADLLNGPTRDNGTGIFSFQVGANAAQTISITFPNMKTSSSGLLSSVAPTAITSTTAANSALGTISSALDRVNLERAKMIISSASLQRRRSHVVALKTQTIQ